MLDWLQCQPRCADVFNSAVREHLQSPLDCGSCVRSIAVISWLEQHSFLHLEHSAAELSAAAASVGALSTLKWLHKRGCLQEANGLREGEKLIVLAAKQGHLAVVRCLHEERGFELMVSA
jgi:hypothetical protein